MFFTNKKFLHHLDDVSLIAVATTKINETVAALNYSCRRLKFGNVTLFTDKPNDKNKKFNQIYIPPFLNVTDWGKFIIFDLHVFIKTKYIILIHHDGFIINPDKWMNEFFEYDFVGAPWPAPNNLTDYRTKNGKIIRVGNSVSLRSKKILELPSQLGVMWPSQNKAVIHEDGFLCVEIRDLLEKNGIKYAPLNLACKFSREIGIVENEKIKPFMFHKWDNKNKNFPLNPQKKLTKLYFFFTKSK